MLTLALWGLGGGIRDWTLILFPVLVSAANMIAVLASHLIFTAL